MDECLIDEKCFWTIIFIYSKLTLKALSDCMLKRRTSALQSERRLYKRFEVVVAKEADISLLYSFLLFASGRELNEEDEYDPMK